MRLRPRFPIAAAALGVATGASALAAGAQAPAPLPPDLQALEQQAQQRPVGSEHLVETVGVSVGGKEVLRLRGDLMLRTQAPFGGTLKAVSGRSVVEERLIGSTLYVHDPKIGRRDRGRPWVRIAKRVLDKRPELNPFLGYDDAAASNPLSFVLTTFAPDAVKEVGPTTADGKAVTEFTGTVDLARAVGRLGVSKQVQSVLKKLGSSSLDLFVASDGLPIRYAVEYGTSQFTATSTVDTVATNIPIVVHPPPAGRTVAYAKVRKLVPAGL